MARNTVPRTLLRKKANFSTYIISKLHTIRHICESRIHTHIFLVFFSRCFCVLFSCLPPLSFRFGLVLRSSYRVCQPYSRKRGEFYNFGHVWDRSNPPGPEPVIPYIYVLVNTTHQTARLLYTWYNRSSIHTLSSSAEVVLHYRYCTSVVVLFGASSSTGI